MFGSVFYNMPLTATGGFTRGGALFSSLLFNAFVCLLILYLYLLANNLFYFVYSCPKESFSVLSMVDVSFKSRSRMLCIIPSPII